MSKGSNRRPEDQKAFGDGYDAIFRTQKPHDDNPDFRMSPDICSVCGERMVNGLCPEILRTQKERT